MVERFVGRSRGAESGGVFQMFESVLDRGETAGDSGDLKALTTFRWHCHKRKDNFVTGFRMEERVWQSIGACLGILLIRCASAKGTDAEQGPPIVV